MMHRTKGALIGGVLVLVAARTAIAEDVRDKVVAQTLAEPAKLMSEWAFSEWVAFLMIVIVAAAGLVILITQIITRPWAKVAAAVLGGVVTLLTTISNSYLEFDYRQYRDMGRMARQIMNDIEIKRIEFKDTAPDERERRQVLVNEIVDKAREVAALPSRFKEKSAAVPAGRPASRTETGLFFFSTAHAQSPAQLGGIPEWVTKPPPDSANLYFVGIADGRGYSEARIDSREHAFDEARQFFAGIVEGRGNKVDADKLARQMVRSGKVQNTHSVYSKERKIYQFYTQVVVSRKFAEEDMRLYLAESGQSPTPEMAKAVQSASRSADDYVAQRQKVQSASLAAAASGLNTQQYDQFVNARNLRLSGRQVEAASVLKELVRAKPDFYLGWFNLARAYDDSGNVRAATEAYERAIALDKAQKVNDASLYNSYGYMLYRQKKPAEAKAQLEHAIALAPGHPTAGRTLAAINAAK